MFLKNLIDHWKPLGLALGLLYPTLKRIETEQRGDIQNCKMEMVAAWLQRQDNVSKKGIPSWKVLRAALVNIGENELADKTPISDGKLHDHYRVMFNQQLSYAGGED